MVGSIYRFYARAPHRGDAFQSLSFGKLTAEREGAVVWSPARPGVDLISRASEIPWSQIIDPREPFWGFQVEMPGRP